METTATQRVVNSRRIAELALATLLLFAVAIALSRISGIGPDWIDHFRPGALNLANPYADPENYAPPWLFVLLWPIAILPTWLGKGVLILATLAIVYRFTGDTERFLWACASMPLFAVVIFGQVDAISLLALIVPPELALILIVAKPQGILLAGLKRLTWRSVAVLLAVGLISIIIWGPWFMQSLNVAGMGHNLSPFPWGLPVAALILWWQWRRGFDSDAALCLATLMTTPYFWGVSLLPVLCCFIKETDDRRLWALAVVASWVYGFVFRVGA